MAVLLPAKLRDFRELSGFSWNRSQQAGKVVFLTHVELWISLKILYFIIYETKN